MRRLILIGLCLGFGCGPASPARLLPGENYSRKEALAGVELGKPIVQAIYRYESDTGCWPYNLDELVPAYVNEGDIKSWRYHAFCHDDFALVYRGPLAGGTLHFDHDAWKPDAWNVWWEDRFEHQHIEKLDVEQPRPGASTLTADERARRRHDLLRKRIDAMPDRVVHRVGLMKHFFDLGRYDAARSVCVACIEKWPDYWWSYLMLAKIESRLGDQGDAERRLVGLAERWNDFFGYAFLAQFYFDNKETAKSTRALQSALRCTPTRLKEQYTFEQIGSRESWVEDCYYHNAAYLAYRMGDHRLCLAVCDAWRQFVERVQRYGGVEERALRIVCAVNDADWDRARDLLEAMKHAPEYASWQQAGVQTLADVIRDRKADYVYDPRLLGPAGAPLRVELDYK